MIFLFSLFGGKMYTFSFLPNHHRRRSCKSFLSAPHSSINLFSSVLLLQVASPINFFKCVFNSWFNLEYQDGHLPIFFFFSRLSNKTKKQILFFLKNEVVVTSGDLKNSWKMFWTKAVCPIDLFFFFATLQVQECTSFGPINISLKRVKSKTKIFSIKVSV